VQSLESKSKINSSSKSKDKINFFHIKFHLKKFKNKGIYNIFKFFLRINFKNNLQQYYQIIEFVSTINIKKYIKINIYQY